MKWILLGAAVVSSLVVAAFVWSIRLRNPHYHRATDTPDTLDFTRMAQVATGLAAVVRGACPPER